MQQYKLLKCETGYICKQRCIYLCDTKIFLVPKIMYPGTWKNVYCTVSLVDSLYTSNLSALAFVPFICVILCGLVHSVSDVYFTNQNSFLKPEISQYSLPPSRCGEEPFMNYSFFAFVSSFPSPFLYFFIFVHSLLVCFAPGLVRMKNAAPEARNVELTSPSPELIWKRSGEKYEEIWRAQFGT